MRTLVIAFAIFAALSTGDGAVSIRTDRRVLFAGQDVTIICKVPRNEANRRIEALLLPDYSSSERQIDGEDAAITHRFTFSHVPPHVTTAACVLTDKYNNHRQATLSLQIAEQ